MAIFRLILIFMALWLGTMGAHVEASDEPCRECHADKLDAPITHSAVAMGCGICHLDVHPKNAPKKKSRLVEQGEKLCYRCHDKARFLMAKVIHPPVSYGDCLSCHDPHGSNATALLKPDMPLLCVNCHDKGKLLGRYVHGPVMIGDCMACHEPHSSKYASLLKSEVPVVCLKCHRRSKFLGRSIHSPVRDGSCLICHAPHAADNRELLSTSGNDLCLQCHPGVAEAPHAMSGGRGPGGHMLKGDKDPRRRGRPFGCISCHDPHSSDSPTLFRYPAETRMEFCSACHKK